MKEVLGAIELPVGSGGNRTDRDGIKENTLDAPRVSDVLATYRIAAVGWVFEAGEPFSLASKALDKCTSARDGGVVRGRTWGLGRQQAGVRPRLHGRHVGGHVVGVVGEDGHVGAGNFDVEGHSLQRKATGKQIPKRQRTPYLEKQGGVGVSGERTME